MVYTKQTWVNGDPTKPLSATRLNKLETQYDEAIEAVEAGYVALPSDPPTVGQGLVWDGAAWVPGSVGGGGSTNPTDAPIVRWGDSFTELGAPTNTQLAEALGRSVYTFGIGGQTSPQIAARQGGKPTMVTVAGGKIPASGSFAVTLSTELVRNSAHTFTGVIAGVKCVYQPSSGADYLVGNMTRVTPGDEVPLTLNASAVAFPVPFITSDAYLDMLPIFSVGRNNYTQVSTVISDLTAMMSRSRKSQYAIIEDIPVHAADVYGSTAHNNIDTINNTIRDTFPQAYLPVHAMLRSTTALAMAGITPTSQDLTDIANGVTPISFRKSGDNLHLNTAGYLVKYQFYAQLYASRGWGISGPDPEPEPEPDAPYSIGTDGIRHWYEASGITGSVGAAVTTWEDIWLSGDFERFGDASGTITIGEDSGQRFTRITGGGAYTYLGRQTPGSRPAAIAMIVRASLVNASPWRGYGYRIMRAANGTWQLNAVSGSVNAGNNTSAWVVVIANLLDSAPTVRVNATEVTGSGSVTASTSGTQTTQVAMEVATSAATADVVCMVEFDHALSLSERNAVHAALVSNHPGLGLTAASL